MAGRFLKLWLEVMAVKIDKKFLSGLPVGLFRIEKGLYVRTRPNGQAYIFIYRFNKKRIELRIGATSEITAAFARTRAAEFRAMLVNGQDPRAERQKKREEQAPELTLAAFIPQALKKIQEIKQWRNEKSWGAWSMTFEQYVVPIIGDKLLAAVNRDDVLSVLAPIWKTKNETASRLRGRLEAIFDLAIVMGLYKNANPAVWRGNLAFFLAAPAKVKNVTHHEALSFDEVKDICMTAFKDEGNLSLASVGWKAVIFGILTGARVGEFVPMKWDEIDFKERVWLCPAKRRKDGLNYPHRVPLSDQALSILNSLDKEKEYVFPGQSGIGHISKETPRILILKRFKHGTMHGCRSTFRDWCAEMGIDRVLAEKSLMHKTGSEVEQAYQRSDLLERRRPLMQQWADALTKE